MSSLSAEQLFLRYASACLNSRAQNGLIAEQDYQALAHDALENISPPRALLEKCFPDAVQSMFAHAETMHAPPWSFEVVASYWRYHHDGESPVSHATVVFVFADPTRQKSPLPTWRVEVKFHSADGKEGESSVLRSLYELSLRAGDEVTVHMGLIIEKLPK